MGPEQRVELFIADYQRAHQQLSLDMRTIDDSNRFARWAELVAELELRHGVDGGFKALGQVMRGTSPHAPDVEKWVGTRLDGERVYVETHVLEEPLPTFFEYELKQSQREWRIARIREFLDPADAPFVTDNEQPRLSNPPSLPLQKLSSDEIDFDGDSLFIQGREIRCNDGVSTIEVRPVGKLSLSTGQLVVGDLSYDAANLGLLGLRVAPGHYSAEVAIAFDRISALRIRFSNAPIASWHPADQDLVGHVVGVDAGNVAIADVAAIIKMKSRDMKRAFETYADNPRPCCLMLSLAHPNDAVISDSGWGDGGYPVYWGVDASHGPVVLIVDFCLYPKDLGDLEMRA